MDLIKELQNYQKLGAPATLLGLKAEKRKIQEIQHTVSVLEVVSQLSSLIKYPEFEKFDIKSMEIYPGSEEAGENKFEIVLLSSKGFGYEKYNHYLIHILTRIHEILDVIETGEEFMGDTSNTIIIDFTPGGLKELQNYLLSPALQISLEKALLADAVKPLAATHENVAPVLKI